jgi:hypothetical protein
VPVLLDLYHNPETEVIAKTPLEAIALLLAEAYSTPETIQKKELSAVR